MKSILPVVAAALLSFVFSRPCVAQEKPGVAPVASATPLRASVGPCTPWPGDADSARKHLEEARQITTSEGIGLGGVRSLESRAFLKLYRSEKPGDAFAALYSSAKTTEGKFWALLGLRFVKDPREEALRTDFLGSKRELVRAFLGGCCGDLLDPRTELPRWLAAIDAGDLKGLVVVP